MPRSLGTSSIAYAVTAVSVFGASSVSPILPDIVRALSVSEAQASTLISLFILPMALITPIAGLVADRIAIRPVLIASLLLYTLGGLACYFSRDFTVLLTWRILQGTGAAALELFGLVLLIETVPASQRHAAIARNAAVIGISTAAAPLLAGGLALFSWRMPFLTAIAGLPLALCVLTMDEPPKPPQPREPQAWASLLVRPQVLASFALILIAFYFLFGVLLSFVPEMAAREGMTSPVLIAMLPALSAISISLTAPLSARLIQRFSTAHITIASLTVYLAAMLTAVASAEQGVSLLALCCLLIGIGHGLLFPLAQSLMASQSPATGRILFMSFNIAAIGTAQFIAPLATSAIDSISGLLSVFSCSSLLAGMLIAPTAILGAFTRQRHRAKRLQGIARQQRCSQP